MMNQKNNAVAFGFLPVHWDENKDIIGVSNIVYACTFASLVWLGDTWAIFTSLVFWKEVTWSIPLRMKNGSTKTRV